MSLSAAEEGRLRRLVEHASLALADLEQRLHAGGLHHTGQALNRATQRLGWEAAAKLSPHRDQRDAAWRKLLEVGA